MFCRLEIIRVSQVIDKQHVYMFTCLHVYMYACLLFLEKVCRSLFSLNEESDRKKGRKRRRDKTNSNLILIF